MRQLLVTVPNDLDEGLQRYLQQFEDPPAFEAAMVFLLKRQLIMQGFIDDSLHDDLPDIIPATGPKPTLLGDAPILLDGSSIADAAIEDRR